MHTNFLNSLGSSSEHQKRWVEAGRSASLNPSFLIFCLTAVSAAFAPDTVPGADRIDLAARPGCNKEAAHAGSLTHMAWMVSPLPPRIEADTRNLGVSSFWND